jgi:hypothetical protein
MYPEQNSLYKDLPGRWEEPTHREIWRNSPLNGKNYEFIIQPDKSTTSNPEKQNEIQVYKEKKLAEGYHNSRVFTLSYGRPNIDDTSSGFDLLNPGERIVFTIGSVDYFEHLAFVTGDVKGLRNPNSMLASANCYTKDGFLVFAQRNENVSAGKGQIGVIGGTYDSIKIENDQIPDPFDIINDEVETELGFNKEAMGKIDTWFSSLIKDKLSRIVLMFHINLPLKADELTLQFQQSGQNEHRNLIMIKDTEDSILQFMKDHSPEDFHPPADALLVMALQRHRIQITI